MFAVTHFRFALLYKHALVFYEYIYSSDRLLCANMAFVCCVSACVRELRSCLRSYFSLSLALDKAE